MADDPPRKPRTGSEAGRALSNSLMELAQQYQNLKPPRISAPQLPQLEPRKSAPVLEGSEEPGEVAGGGKGPTRPKSPKTIRSTNTRHRPRVLSVKEYPLAEDRLDNIGTLRGSSAFWAAIGSLGLGFVLSTWQALSLAGSDVPADTVAAWRAYLKASIFVTVVAYSAAIFYYFKGKSVLQYVKDNTTHDELD